MTEDEYVENYVRILAGMASEGAFYLLFPPGAAPAADAPDAKKLYWANSVRDWDRKIVISNESAFEAEFRTRNEGDPAAVFVFLPHIQAQ